jgi:hypothetical protein
MNKGLWSHGALKRASETPDGPSNHRARSPVRYRLVESTDRCEGVVRQARVLGALSVSPVNWKKHLPAAACPSVILGVLFSYLYVHPQVGHTQRLVLHLLNHGLA